MHRFPIAAKRSSICNPVREAEAGEAQYINTTDYNTAQYTRLPRTNTATRGTWYLYLHRGMRNSRNDFMNIDTTAVLW